MPAVQPIAIAVVEHEGRFLVGRRPAGVPLAGLWEFPGGKAGGQESIEAAAVRECLEETGARVVAEGVLDRTRYEYPHATVELTFVRCRLCDPSDVVSSRFQWIDRATLATLEFPPANRPLIDRLVTHGSAVRHSRFAATVGRNAFRYGVLVDWAQRPDPYSWIEVVGMAVDAHDRVFVFNRGEFPVMVFDRNGGFLNAWGQGIFTRPHGITVGPDGAIYCTDDVGHTVRKFAPDGTLLQTWGVSGHPSDTGATSLDYRTIQRSGPPFHYPTNVTFSTEGELYVSDGYGNARVHKFSADGRLLLSWGEPGGGPGQFRIPHGIATHADGRVFVADRENCRIQIFSPDGVYLDQLTDIARPCQVAFDGQGHLFVAELGFRAGMWPGTDPPSPDATGGRVSVFDSHGHVVARWGGGDDPTAPGDFFAPHDLCLDSHGDVYVAEVVISAGGNRGLIAPTCHTLQKFVRLEGSPT